LKNDRQVGRQLRFGKSSKVISQFVDELINIKEATIDALILMKNFSLKE